MNFGDYDIKFDINNSNSILIFKGNKCIHIFCCPPIKSGCDIINFSGQLGGHYLHNSESIILITSKKYRKIYYKGKLIGKINKKNIKC